MTEAGTDRWRARGREGKTARAREEWSTVAKLQRERKERGEKREGIFHHEVREENMHPEPFKSSETIQHHFNSVKTTTGPTRELNIPNVHA